MIKVMLVNVMRPTDKYEYSPSLGLSYLVSFARQHFGKNTFSFKIIDRNVEEEVLKFKPDIIGISSVSENYNGAIRLAKFAKTQDIHVIVGGIHISAMPETLTDDMDVGVIREGEQTFVELLGLYENGRFDKNTFQDIYGLVYKDSRLRLTKPRELIKPLDKIPFPARDLFQKKGSATIFSSRGCPYNCIFCSSARFWKMIRFFSAEYVVSEIKYLMKKYNVNHIAFADDLFIADKNRLKKIVELVKADGIDEKVSFSCHCRANLLDSETAKLLKEMNLNEISMGLESGCPRTLMYLKGHTITVEDNRNAVTIANEHGMQINASFIIGAPQETKEEIIETLEFIKSLNLNAFYVYLLTPLPATPLWDFAKEKGIISNNMDWDALKFDLGKNYEKAIILSQTLTRKELYKLFLLFKNEQKKIMFKKIIEVGIRNPIKIPKFLIRQLFRRRNPNV